MPKHIIRTRKAEEGFWDGWWIAWVDNEQSKFQVGKTEEEAITNIVAVRKRLLGIEFERSPLPHPEEHHA